MSLIQRIAFNICKNKLKHWWFSKKTDSQDDQLMGSHQLDVDETSLYESDGQVLFLKEVAAGFGFMNAIA